MSWMVFVLHVEPCSSGERSPSEYPPCRPMILSLRQASLTEDLCLAAEEPYGKLPHPEKLIVVYIGGSHAPRCGKRPGGTAYHRIEIGSSWLHLNVPKLAGCLVALHFYFANAF